MLLLRSFEVDTNNFLSSADPRAMLLTERQHSPCCVLQSFAGRRMELASLTEKMAFRGWYHLLLRSLIRSIQSFPINVLCVSVELQWPVKNTLESLWRASVIGHHVSPYWAIYEPSS